MLDVDQSVDLERLKTGRYDCLLHKKGWVVDTVEELNGTYFYAGRSNLTASELFFMIFCETTADHFGVDDVVAVAALYSGVNNQKTRTKPKGAKEGTSVVA